MAIRKIAVDIKNDILQAKGEFSQLEAPLRSIKNKLISGLAIVEDLSDQLINIAEALEEVDNRIPEFGQIAPKLAAMGLAITSIGAVTGAAGYFSSSMSEGLIIVEGLSTQLINLAEALEEINNRVPELGQVYPKLASMGVAITGMLAVTGAAGLFSSGMSEGLIIVEGLSSQLINLSEALEEINNRVPELGQVYPKLASMGVAITGMLAVTGASGLFSSGMSEGLIIVEGLSSQLINLAEALEEINNRVPELGQVYPKLASMGVAITGMLAVTGASGLFSSGMIEGLIIVEGLSIQLINLAEALEEINNRVPELGQVYPKLASMGIAIGGMMAVTGAAGLFSSSMIEGLVIVEALTDQLLELAIAMEQIDNTVPEFGQIAPKLASMGIAIGGMMAVTGAAGLFSSSMIEGLVIVEALTDQLLELAIAMEQIDNTVPEFGQIAPKLASMGIAIGGMMAVTGAAGLFSSSMIEGLVIVEALTDQLLELAIAMEQIDNTVPEFGQIAPKLATMGIAIGGMTAVTLIAGTFSSSMKKGLIIVEQLSRQLLTVATALKKVDQYVTDDLSSIYGKLAAMGVALVGMAGLAAVFGLLVKSGIGALVAVGSVMKIGLAANLIIVANAIQQVDEGVPDNLDTVISKIEGIGTVLTAVASSTLSSAMGLIGNMVGLLNTAILVQTLSFYVTASETMKELQDVQINKEAILDSVNNISEALKAVADGSTTDAMSLIGNFLGMLNTAVLIETVEMYAEVVETLQSLEEVNIQKEAVLASIETIGEALEAVASDGTVSAFGVLSNFLGMVDTAILAETVGIYAEAAKDLQSLERVDFDLPTVQTNIGKIEEAMNSLERSSGGIFGFLTNNRIDTSTVEAAREVFGNFVYIAEAIETIKNAQIVPSVVKSQIAKLQSTFSVLQDVEGIVQDYSIDTETVAAAAEAIQNFEKIATAIKTIQEVTIEPALVESQIRELQNAINHLKDVEEIVGEGQIDTETIEYARQAMDGFRAIAEAIDTIQDVYINPGIVSTQIDRLQEVVKYIGEVNEQIREIEIDTEAVSYAAAAMGYFRTIAEAIEVIQDVYINPVIIDYQVGKLQQVVTNLQAADGEIKEMKIDTVNVANAATAMGYFQTIAQAVEAIQDAEIKPDIVKKQLGKLKEVAQHLYNKNETLTNIEIDTTGVQRAATAMGHFETIANAIRAIQEADFNYIEAKERIDEALQVIGRIRDFITDSTDIGDISPIQASIDEFTSLVTSLAGLSVKFGTVGTSFGTQLLEAFKSVQIPNTVLEKISTLITNLANKATDFRDIGRNYGERLKEAFTNAVEDLNSKVSSEITIVESFATRFTTIGMNFGTNLVNAFETEFNRISGIVSRQIQILQTQLNNLSAPSIRGFSGGGLVSPLFFNKGGFVPATPFGTPLFTPMGSDTVPAMLTPGEFVQKKSAVSKFGLDFMKRVNNGDITGAFHAMTSRFNIPATTTSSVSNAVQNINNTTNNANRITMNTQSDNPSFIMKRIGRYL